MPDQSFDVFVKKIISSAMPDVKGTGQGTITLVL